MAAKDLTKEPQATSPGNNKEMHIKDENAQVSVERALEALKEAQRLLEAHHDTNTEWQDPVVLLNTTAAALDEAALALRKDDGKDKPQNDQAAMVSDLSQQIIRGRQNILDATQKVVSGTRPAELWNPNTLIVYATHTGTSKDYALELQSHLESADVMNIKDVSLLDLQERRRVYFVCSTFGLGRPPRDAEMVYTTLQIIETADPEDDILVAAPEKEVLSGLEVAVASLGNSKFDAFGKFGRDLSVRLCGLGAQEILPVTLLDSKNGPHEQRQQFHEWQNAVLNLEGIAPKERACADIENSLQAKPAESSCCVIL